jgi:phosphohistidine phosphatase
MKVYLVRHGQAEDRETDPERHLTAAGRGDVRALGAYLRAQRVKVARVWHSGKTRAVETAEIVAGKIRVTGEVEARSGLNPNDSAAELARELARMDEDVMIVGHMPFLSELVSVLVARGAGEVVTFRTAGACCLERDDGGTWRLAWLVSPGALPEERQVKSKK